ncbi:MAG TPA: diaminopimelate decarboxylase [Streptosporangiaceae bacterium]|nr:diaminopimelate decarboxylase [Streptosporangiaceae bacterium]
MPDLSLLPPSATIDGDDLRIGGVSLRALAAEFGTPAYVLDEDALRDRAREYARATGSRHPASRVCFAVKAFPSASVIRVLAQEGLGCDVVGAGELRIALAAGADPARIVMHGNAKSDDDIRAALQARISYIVVDGFDDIDRISRLATAPVPVLLRVTPGIDSATHAAMATGGASSKFGLPVDQVPEAIRRMTADPLLDLQGLHAHIGSQILELDQFEAEAAALAGLGRFPVYDLGGGLGVRYLPEESAPSIDEYAARLISAAHRHLGRGFELVVEPGRSLVAPAGLTLYRVVTRKEAGRVHVAVDGGMGDNLEHSLYGQRFSPLVVGRWDAPRIVADLVGRHCESGDVITPGVELADPRIGDLVVVPVTGAYCFTMANNYNAALRPPVVLCSGGTARLAVRRETPEDLMAREVGLADPEPAPLTRA